MDSGDQRIRTRLIIAGPRDYDRTKVDAHLRRAMEEWKEKHGGDAFHSTALRVVELVSGHSGVVDLAGERWARSHGIDVVLFPYPSSKGKAGGPIRNHQMAKHAHDLALREIGGGTPMQGALVVLRDGRDTRGTSNMVATATKLGLLVEEYRFQ